MIALPELLDKQITENDEYVVLCSDGVFEFISNQMAMDIVEKCGEPLAACHALVQEAYKLWLQFDVRTDDITAIVLKLCASDRRDDGPSSAQLTSARPNEAAELVRELDRAAELVEQLDRGHARRRAALVGGGRRHRV